MFITMFNFVYKDIDFAHKLDKAGLPNEDYGKHMHHFYEILFFIKGDVHYTIESNTEKLREGDLLIIHPGQYHFAVVNGGLSYERYVLKFPSSVLPQYLEERLKEKNPCFIRNLNYESSFKEFDLYDSEYKEDDLYTLFICQLMKLVVSLCKEKTSTPSIVNNMISKVVSYIDNNIQSPLTLTDISKACHYSKSYISNGFKQHMKTPIMKYVRYKKMIAAHQMILSGEKKRVVANMFGYDDYSTFYRTYKKAINNQQTDSKYDS